MSVDTSDKRSLSQPASPITARHDALRTCGKLSRISKSQFMTPIQSTTDMHTSVGSAIMEELPAAESFPFNLSESASHAFGSIGQFVSGGNLATTGLALGIHGGVEQASSSAISCPVVPIVSPSTRQDVLSMAAIEIMMNRMFAQHQIHADERQRQLNKEFEGRPESEMKRVITLAIAQHVQPLHASIGQEKTERQKAISDMQGQIINLRDEVRALNNDSNLHPRDTRTGEVNKLWLWTKIQGWRSQYGK